MNSVVFQGLITFTSLIEKIVGSTGEEGIRPKEKYITLEPNTYEIDGAMNIDEANDELELNIPEGDYETIAGFILENFQKDSRNWRKNKLWQFKNNYK